MSRAGYTNDCEDNSCYLWIGTIRAAINGRRGQKFLRELETALDAMPVKELVANELESEGSFCTLGAICHAKSIPTAAIDPEDYLHWDVLSEALNIAPSLVREIEYQNDDWRTNETPARRWQRMRAWVGNQIKAKTV